MNNISENKTLSFEDLANYLFSFAQPPPPKSIVLEIAFDDNDSSVYDFLYNLVLFGVKKKLSNIDPQELTENHFNFIKKYINAIGYDMKLLNYYYTNNDSRLNFEITFNNYI